MSARAHAAQQAVCIVESQQFPEAEAAVEVIPGTGGDLGLGADRTGHNIRASSRYGQGVCGGMHDEGSRPPRAWLSRRSGRQDPRHPAVCRRVPARGQSRFLFVEAEDDVELRLELGDELQGTGDVAGEAHLLRIGEVEDAAARSGDPAQQLALDGAQMSLMYGSIVQFTKATRLEPLNLDANFSRPYRWRMFSQVTCLSV